MSAGAIVHQGNVQGGNVRRGKFPVLPWLTNHFQISYHESWSRGHVILSAWLLAVT